MKKKREIKRLVIGLGNNILGDDGAGIYAVRELKERYHSERGLSFEEASTGGIGLLDLIDNHDEVVLIDAIITGKGQPGQIYRMEIDELRPAKGLIDPHHLDIRTACTLGERLGYNMPKKFWIYAIEIEEDKVFSDHVSDAVRKGILNLINQLSTDLSLPLPHQDNGQKGCDEGHSSPK